MNMFNITDDWIPTISLLSLIMSVAAFVAGYICIPRRERKQNAEYEFVRLLRTIIEDYSQYQTYTSYNGTPLTKAARLKVKIMTSCELLTLSVKRMGKHPSRHNHRSRVVQKSIEAFVEKFRDSEFDKMINVLKDYIRTLN